VANTCPHWSPKSAMPSNATCAWSACSKMTALMNTRKNSSPTNAHKWKKPARLPTPAVRPVIFPPVPSCVISVVPRPWLKWMGVWPVLTVATPNAADLLRQNFDSRVAESFCAAHLLLVSSAARMIRALLSKPWLCNSHLSDWMQSDNGWFKIKHGICEWKTQTQWLEK